ncbi:MAG: hypothetical protein ACI94Y_003528 [Maribacter sp.]|jgi:hypothetical protein
MEYAPLNYRKIFKMLIISSLRYEQKLVRIPFLRKKYYSLKFRGKYLIKYIGKIQ